MSTPNVTVEISTKNRYYTTLPLAIASILHQTVKPDFLFIYDDGEHKDLREDAVYFGLFKMLDAKGIQWRFYFGERKGQVLNHQKCLEMAETEWIWRFDDDDYAEPDALEKLLRHTETPDVGGVGSLILFPGKDRWHSGLASGKIEDIYATPNLQWHRQIGVKEVDHFNNSFLFRKSAAAHGYCMDLSPVGHREETIFTHEIKRNGFRLLLDPEAIVWHLRDPNGGIRSHQVEEYFHHDEAIFTKKMAEWGVKPTQFELIIMDNGMGDHIAFKMVLPKILKKYPNTKFMLSLCYPEIFKEYNHHPQIQIISIADSHELGVKQEDYNIYKWMGDNNWKGKLHEAFAARYGVKDAPPIIPVDKPFSPFVKSMTAKDKLAAASGGILI